MDPWTSAKASSFSERQVKASRMQLVRFLFSFISFRSGMANRSWCWESTIAGRFRMISSWADSHVPSRTSKNFSAIFCPVDRKKSKIQTSEIVVFFSYRN